jgi:D-proline reductase (dithiol) PrdB
MPIDLKELMGSIADSGRAKTPLSRLTFIRNVATDEELAELFGELLIQAAEAKHADDMTQLVRFIEQWEDWTLARVAAEGWFPDIQDIPWAPFTKPLSEARIALMTSGGLFVEGQEPFALSNDPTYRQIPRGTTQEQVRAAHRGYDINGPLEDMNCLLPLTRMAELEAEGRIGALADTNFSFNGSIPDVANLQSWPHEVAAILRQEQVDAILLTPA